MQGSALQSEFRLARMLSRSVFRFSLLVSMLMLRLELVLMLPSLGRRSSILVKSEVRALCKVLLFHFQEYLWSNNSSRIIRINLPVS